MDLILLNNTWVIVYFLQTFKARLLAKGFKQKEYINYFDTYEPVSRIKSIRVLMTPTSIFYLYVHQMVVKTEFLNSDLDEEVYMKQSKGFVMYMEDAPCPLNSFKKKFIKYCLLHQNN
jgi:hypothetical protein